MTETSVGHSELVTIDDFFFGAYGDFILLGLNTFLNYGMISHVLGGINIPIQPITAENCEIIKTNYWWVDRNTFLADLAIILTLKIPRGSLKTGLHASLKVNVANDAETNFSDFGKDAKLPDRKGEYFLLDRYLVPYMSSHKVDRACRLMLDRYIPSWREEGCVLDYKKLLKRKGLNVMSIPLRASYKRNSILFFEDGYVIDEAGARVRIPAGTIVHNANSDPKFEARNDLHEAFHDEYHFLAYWLQKRATSNPWEFPVRPGIEEDFTPLPDEDVLADEEEPSEDSFHNPITTIEWQARKAELRLLLPREVFAPFFDSILSNINPQMGTGTRYNIACRKTACILDIPKATIRTRAIQLGHVGAMGCLNYIPPYKGIGGYYAACFSFSSLEYGETFCITPKELETLMKDSHELRVLMESSTFVYVDGHVCINSPLVVRTIADERRLTNKALKDLSKCCLRFRVRYVNVAPGILRRGILYRDDEGIQRTAFFLREYIKDGALIVGAMRQYIATCKGLYFPELLAKLRTDAELTQFELACKSGLSEMTVRRLETGKTKRYTFDIVALLAKGLMLPFWITDMLFKAAGLSPSNEREETIIYYLTYYIMESVNAFQAFLVENGLEPLKGATSSKAVTANYS